ncbi:MAG: succinate dehydrogenase/fumarate reductase flavoprotein subunit [Thermoplasmata archaeon M9B1D]|nr:MAG: succinate dehydrogenase/fumarate reductase flavoprotein subunit [Thermoplasmata archaeon M9B1D]PNX52145.1 MAG: succinate dehydrogenase/fumarate reductase flavoprotein subunit [Thermoplasmata archaeon M8B2D]
MMESIKLVEKKREHNMKHPIKPMNMKEREDMLGKYHPDYMQGTRRELRVGVDKGQIFYNGIVDLLESRPVLDPKDVDLSKIDYDVDLLIIGGGGAGTVAALFARESGIPIEKILIVTKLRHGDANSMMAQGGIQAADRPNDNPALHYLDIYGGGHFTNKPELARALALDAPLIINWHEQLGVMYDRLDDGEFQELSGGGTCRNRMHSCKDYSGMEIMRNIRDNARNLQIPVLEFCPIAELIMDDKGQVAGAVAFNLETYEYYVIRAKATILATGGSGRLHLSNYPTTNHYGATGDGLVMAYHVGANLLDLDTIQIHPTGDAFPEPIVGILSTEKIRGLGAIPLNADGDPFVFPLEPRDVESASLIRECKEGRGVVTPTGMPGVWLDTPMIEIIHGEGTIATKLSGEVRKFKRFNIDITKHPILVYPTLHYQNGGVEINEKCETRIPGLFAAGEVSGGVHGKNRLMGNSLLDFNVFGRRAGIYAAKYVKKAKIGKLTLSHLNKYNKILDNAGIKPKKTAPIILPEYRGEMAISRSLDIF